MGFNLRNVTGKIESNCEVELLEFFPDFEDFLIVSKEELGGVCLKKLIAIEKLLFG